MFNSNINNLTRCIDRMLSKKFGSVFPPTDTEGEEYFNAFYEIAQRQCRNKLRLGAATPKKNGAQRRLPEAYTNAIDMRELRRLVSRNPEWDGNRNWQNGKYNRDPTLRQPGAKTPEQGVNPAGLYNGEIPPPPSFFGGRRRRTRRRRTTKKRTRKQRRRG